MRRRRIATIVLVAGGFTAVTLMVGLITNAASSQGSWPRWLAPFRSHPWQWLAVSAILTIGLAATLAVLSDPGASGSANSDGAPGADGPEGPDAATVKRCLPRGAASFIDREELARLLLAAIDARGGSGVIPICALDGMPGVGKTAFAIHLGHLLADRFPDGQLFLDLHGHAPGKRPVNPMDALSSLLVADGVSAARIPVGADPGVVIQARASLWRSRVAGRRMLIVLDNAASYPQVEPLLPGAGESLVIVTSRRRLIELEGVTVAIETLSDEDAKALLVRASGRDPDVLDRDAIAELTAMSGNLPLAVALLAAQLRHHPRWTATGLASRLRAARDRSGALRAGDRGVAATFDLSYQALPEPRRRVFRRLGWHPGESVEAHVLAALVDAPLDVAQEHLEALYDSHLVDEIGDGRYRAHDLIRDFSRSLAEREDLAERAPTMRRLTAYYLKAAAVANRWIERPGVRAPAGDSVAPAPCGGLADPSLVRSVPEPRDRQHALTWLEDERAAILALIEEAAATDQPERVVALTAAMAPYLRRFGPWDQAVRLHRRAAAAAERCGSPRARGEALAETGVVLRLMADYPAAVESLTTALDVLDEAGDRRGRGHVLNQLGIVWYLTATYPAAADAQTKALGIFTECDDQLGRANALADLGMVRRQISEYAEAEAAQSKALEIYRRLGDQYGEANVLRDLGIVHTLRGDYTLAAERQAAALEIYRRLGDRAHQGYALNELGTVRRLVGDHEGAAALHLSALDLYSELGDRFGQANSLRAIGTLRRATADHTGAVDAQTEAIGLYRDLGNRSGEAACLAEIGVVRGAAGDADGAEAAFGQALSAFRELGDRWAQAELYNHWGTLLLVRDPSGALEMFERAAELAERVGCPAEWARALDGIGRCQLGLGDRTAAENASRRALEIFRSLRSNQAIETAAYLASRVEADHPE